MQANGEFYVIVIKENAIMETTESRVKIIEAKAIKLIQIMEERNYPGCVIDTVIGAIDIAHDQMKAAELAEKAIQENTDPKAIIKAMQPIIREVYPSTRQKK